MTNKREQLWRRELLGQQGYREANGVIYRGDRMLNCSEADWLAQSVGFIYAEHLVEFLAQQREKAR